MSTRSTSPSRARKDANLVKAASKQNGNNLATSLTLNLPHLSNFLGLSEGLAIVKTYKWLSGYRHKRSTQQGRYNDDEEKRAKEEEEAANTKGCLPMNHAIRLAAQMFLDLRFPSCFSSGKRDDNKNNRGPVAFEAFIIVNVVLNALIMVYAGPDKMQEEKWGDGFETWQIVENVFDIYFLVVFTLELVIKVLAQGLLTSRNAYLRDFHNVLDFVVVIFMYMERFSTGGVQLSALRAFRLVKLLGLVKAFVRIQVLLKTIGWSLYFLALVFVILLFLVATFAIMGIGFFNHNIVERCVVTKDYVPNVKQVCGMSNFSCPGGTICSSDDSFGPMHPFRDIGVALLAMCQCLVTPNYAMMYMDELSAKEGIIAPIFFIVYLLIVMFLVSKLTTAIINFWYSDTYEKFIELPKLRIQKGGGEIWTMLQVEVRPPPAELGQHELPAIHLLVKVNVAIDLLTRETKTRTGKAAKTRMDIMSSLQAQALCNGILDDINSIFVSRYVDFFGDAAHTVGAKRRNAFNRMRSSDAAARCGITSHLVEMWPCGSTFVTDEDRLYLTHVKDMTVFSLVESEIWDAGNQSIMLGPLYVPDFPTASAASLGSIVKGFIMDQTALRDLIGWTQRRTLEHEIAGIARNVAAFRLSTDPTGAPQEAEQPTFELIQSMFKEKIRACCGQSVEAVQESAAGKGSEKLSKKFLRPNSGSLDELSHEVANTRVRGLQSVQELVRCSNAAGATAVHIAASRGDVKLLSLFCHLLMCTPCSKDVQLIDMWLQGPELELVRPDGDPALLEEEHNPNGQAANWWRLFRPDGGLHPIHSAAMHNTGRNAETVVLLINLIGPMTALQIRDNNGHTVLWHACRSGARRIVDELLNYIPTGELNRPHPTPDEPDQGLQDFQKDQALGLHNGAAKQHWKQMSKEGVRRRYSVAVGSLHHTQMIDEHDPEQVGLQDWQMFVEMLDECREVLKAEMRYHVRKEQKEQEQADATGADEDEETENVYAPLFQQEAPKITDLEHMQNSLRRRRDKIKERWKELASVERQAEEKAENSNSVRGKLRAFVGVRVIGDGAEVRMVEDDRGVSPLDQIILLVIVLNVVFMASKSHGMSQGDIVTISTASLVFAFIFLAESILKMVTYGLSGYFRNNWNRFDMFVVVITFIPYLIELFALPNGGQLPNISIIRLLRLVRVFRMVKVLTAFESFMRLANTMVESGNMLTPLFLLMFFMLTLFSVLGMQLFGGTYSPGMHLTTRDNFDSFVNALFSLFQVMTGANWVESMYRAALTADSVAAKFLTFMFFWVFFILFRYIFVNLFIATVVRNFDFMHKQEVEMADDKKKTRERLDRLNNETVPTVKMGFKQRGKGWQKLQTKNITPVDIRTGKKQKNPDDPKDSSWADHKSLTAVTVISHLTHKAGVNTSKRPSYSLLLFSDKSDIRQFATHISTHKYFERLILFAIVVSSVFLALEVPVFDLSDRNPETVEIFRICNQIFLVVFLIEFLLKVIAYGFLFPFPKKNVDMDKSDFPAYLHGEKKKGEERESSLWNRLDFVVVAVSLIDLYNPFGDTDISFLRVLRMLRVLRTLKLIKHYEGLKRVILSVGFSFQVSFLPVVILAIFLFLVFGILGIDLFSGRFFKCNDLGPEITGKVDCLGVYQQDLFEYSRGSSEPVASVPMPRVWSDSASTFNDIGKAMLTLFRVMTMDGWTDVLHAAQDVRTGPDLQPRQDKGASYEYWVATLYFITFVFLASFFITQLFLGAVIYAFRKTGPDKLMTDKQKAWSDLNKIMIAVVQPETFAKRPEHAARLHDGDDDDSTVDPALEGAIMKVFTAVRQLAFDITQPCPYQHAECQYRGRSLHTLHSWFENFIMLTIFLNVVSMMLVWENQSEDLVVFLQTAGDVFKYIYTAEMALKIIALGPSTYVQEPWNCFDAFIVITSWIEVPSDGSSSESSTKGTQAARIFRVARMIRLLRKAEMLKILMSCLYTSGFGILNISFLLLIGMFVMTVTGMRLFGTTKFGKHYNANHNFRTIDRGLLLLFDVLLGNWAGYSEDLSNGPGSPYCTDVFGTGAPYHNFETKIISSDCGSEYAWLFFVIFILMGRFLMLNLLIAVLVDSFNSQYNVHKQDIQPKDIDGYIKAWSAIDHKQEGLIPATKLKQLLRNLDYPFGRDPDRHLDWYQDLLITLGKTVTAEHKRSDGKLRNVPMADLLMVLAGISSGNDDLDKSWEEAAQSQELRRELQLEVASRNVQRYFRGYLTRKYLPRVLLNEAVVGAKTDSLTNLPPLPWGTSFLHRMGVAKSSGHFAFAYDIYLRDLEKNVKLQLIRLAPHIQDAMFRHFNTLQPKEPSRFDCSDCR